MGNTLRKKLAGITREHTGRQIAEPLEFLVPGIGPVRCEKVLRVIPAKRATFLAKSGSASLVVKLFYAFWGARRHWTRSAAGCRLFLEKDMKAPEILFSGYLPEYRVYALIFECIEGAVLDRAVQDAGDRERNTLQVKILETIAAQHACGLLQEDLHLGNFMIKDGTIYSLDGDHVRDRPPNRRESLGNLALLFVNHPVFLKDPDFWIRTYAKKRGWVVISDDELARIRASVLRIRKQKVNNHLKRAYGKLVLYRPGRSLFFLYDPGTAGENLPAALESWKGLEEIHSGYGCMSVNGEDVRIWSSLCRGPLFLRPFWPVIRVLMAAYLLRSLSIGMPEPLAIAGRRTGLMRWQCSFLFRKPDAKPLTDLTDSDPVSGDNQEIAVNFGDSLSILRDMDICLQRLYPEEIFASRGKVIFTGLDAVRRMRAKHRPRHALDTFFSRWQPPAAIREAFFRECRARGLI